ncbi:MAG TPA: EamA family transporter [Ktedonobacteraceae bacterium]|nr:EamA family transporter [Ktedonobacteraceae bacterium]
MPNAPVLSLIRIFGGRGRSVTKKGYLLVQPTLTGEQPRRYWIWQKPWFHTFWRRAALIAAPIVTNGLYASVAVSQESLHHIDPLIFVACQMVLLLPVALGLLWSTRGAFSSWFFQQGAVGGLLLGVGFVCVALSLRTIGVVPTASLTALDGVLMSGFSWLVLRRKHSSFTCLAAICALGGALLLWWIAPGALQTDVLALGCGLLFTAYSFHVERSAVMQAQPGSLVAFFGGLFISMAAVTTILALCFGSWPSARSFTATDLELLLYTSLATVLIPVVLSTLLLRRLSAVTLAFCAILEPTISLGLASLLGTLSMSWTGWLGIGLILLSVLVQAISAAAARVPEAHQINTVDSIPSNPGGGCVS